MSDLLVQQMLTTIIEAQKAQAKDISDIKVSMASILVIEEKQANQKEALQRLGKHLDKVDATLTRETDLLHKRINDLGNVITDVRIVSAKLVTKVSLIAGGSGGTLLVIYEIFNNLGQ